jgi:hypothetical protein
MIESTFLMPGRQCAWEISYTDLARANGAQACFLQAGSGKTASVRRFQKDDPGKA